MLPGEGRGTDADREPMYGAAERELSGRIVDWGMGWDILGCDIAGREVSGRELIAGLFAGPDLIPL